MIQNQTRFLSTPQEREPHRRRSLPNRRTNSKYTCGRPYVMPDEGLVTETLQQLQRHRKTVEQHVRASSELYSIHKIYDGTITTVKCVLTLQEYRISGLRNHYLVNYPTWKVDIDLYRCKNVSFFFSIAFSFIYIYTVRGFEMHAWGSWMYRSW